MPIAIALSPNFNASRSRQAKTKSIAFGDGYRQVSPAGLDSIEEEWQIQADYLSVAEAQQLESILAELAGRPFYWEPRPGQQNLYSCSRWEMTPLAADQVKFAAIFSRATRVKDLG